MIKDIVVHLTGSEEDNLRLDCAETLATGFGAHLTGLLVHVEPQVLASPEPPIVSLIQDWMAEAEKKTRERYGLLSLRFQRMPVPNDLRVVSAYARDVGHRLAAEARTADLFIGTRPYGDPARTDYIEDAVLFGSGCACLWIPPRTSIPPSFDTIMVAWKNSREAARAVKDALPFLISAKQVVVALADSEPGEQSGRSRGGDIGRYLSRHGVSAEIRELTGWTSAADALLNEAARSGAQMIVAGGYGHSRLMERVLGGVTRSLLSTAPIPVLMSR